jgi:hypothetical protein
MADPYAGAPDPDAAANDLLSVGLITQRRAELAGHKLSSFAQLVKVGGKDPDVQQTAGYVDSGVCSYVYRAVRADGGCGGAPLALKVMINMGHAQSKDFVKEFEREFKLLLDPDKLPPHANIMPVFAHFTDDAKGDVLPGWNFDPSCVMERTSFIVMPFFERDLKNALISEVRVVQGLRAQRGGAGGSSSSSRRKETHPGLCWVWRAENSWAACNGSPRAAHLL